MTALLLWKGIYCSLDAEYVVTEYTCNNFRTPVPAADPDPDPDPDPDLDPDPDPDPLCRSTALPQRPMVPHAACTKFTRGPSPNPRRPSYPNPTPTPGPRGLGQASTPSPWCCAPWSQVRGLHGSCGVQGS